MSQAKADNRTVDAYVVIALLGAGLLLTELLLPTGGVLAVLGALGLVAGGVLALESDSDLADYVGPGLITLGILSIVTFFFIGRKVLEAHRDEPVRTGSEELAGASAEARTTLDPEGQVWIEGALWRARLEDGAGRWGGGKKVRGGGVGGPPVVVPPAPGSAASEEGAS